jgi:hypothetical protein
VGLDRLALAHGNRGGGAWPGKVVVVAVGLAEKIVVVRTADDFLAEISGDALGAVVPENDFAGAD